MIYSAIYIHILYGFFFYFFFFFYKYVLSRYYLLFFYRKQGSSNIHSRIGRTKTDSNSASNSGSRLSGRVRERARDTSNQDNDRRKTSSQRKVITYDELDADLDAYMAIDVSITSSRRSVVELFTIN